jgi:hypothetical protein
MRSVKNNAYQKGFVHGTWGPDQEEDQHLLETESRRTCQRDIRTRYEADVEAQGGQVHFQCAQAERVEINDPFHTWYERCTPQEKLRAHRGFMVVYVFRSTYDR